MSTKTSSLATSSVPATLARVLDELLKLNGLKPQPRQNMCSSIRRLCQVLERSPDNVPANLNALEILFDRSSPGTLSLSPRRWRNIKSDVRRAVKLFGEQHPVPDSKIPLSDGWETLCKSGPHPTVRSILRRFGRFCCVRQLSPNQVTDEVVRDFAQSLEEQGLSKTPQRILDDTIRAWNRYVAGGDSVRLTPINRSCAYTLKWEDLPASLKQDTDAWHETCLKPDPFDPDAPAPVRQATIKQRDRMIRRLATAVVRQGECANDLVDLCALITPERVKKALRFFLDRNGGEPSTQAYEMAQLAVTIAKHWLKLDKKKIQQLKVWAKRLQTKHKGMSAKNEERLRQLRDNRVLGKLFTLHDQIPSKEWRKPPDSRSALRVQTALAIAILSVAPMRIENLRRLDRNDHFVGSFSDKDHILQIRIHARDVKNDVDLTYPVPDYVYNLLEQYMARYQPLLMNGHPSSLLFPGRSGAPKQANSLRRNITDTIRKELGLHVHPHLFRHLAAYLFLKRHPGHYEEVRRILGHKSIRTTIDSYAGLETTTALIRYDAVVLNLIKDAA